MMAELPRNMRAIGPDIGATGATSNLGTPRIADKGNYALKSNFFLARLPHFRLLVFFPHSPLPAFAAVGNESRFETTDMLGIGDAGECGDPLRMMEYEIHGLEIGATAQRATAEHHGAPRNPKER